MTETAPARLRLAVELDGQGAHPASAGPPPADAALLRRRVAAAELGGFDLITLDDSPLPPPADPEGRPVHRIEAGVRAAHVATRTDRTGLAPTLHPATTEPFHLATQLAALDHASRGRGAWVVGQAGLGPDGDAELATIGAALPTPEALRQEIGDVVDTARALWDSWEDDAVIKDVATSRYLDADKVHPVDVETATFSVKGPLITPRPPQGHLVVLLPDVLELDEQADAVLVARPTVTALAERADRARAAGAPLVLAELEVLLDADAPAAERLAALDARRPWLPGERLRHVGSAAELLALLGELAEVVDGVRLHPAELEVDLPLLAAEVLPALDAAGRHRAPQPDATLRATLGLPRPANRYADRRAVRPANRPANRQAAEVTS